MQEVTTFVGVDVAKDELMVCVHGQPGTQRLANQAQAVRQWLKSLPAGSAVAVESTGRYHQLLVAQAHALGMPVFVLNARDVFFYAKAMGARGKTDRVDAQLIARYLVEHYTCLRPFQPPTATQAEIDRLLNQRWSVVSKRTALRQSLADATALGECLDELELAFKKMLDRIDARIQSLIDANTDLRHAQQRLQSITGIGLQSSALLASLLSRIPFASADALVAYSGLDPRPCDSGRYRGRRRLSKRGPAALRRQMYLVAFSACHSKLLHPIYQKLRDQGFKTTEALVILARKLLRVAFAVWKSGQPFDPALIGQKKP
jgi:transposase